MLVDKQNELMSDLLFTVHDQHGGDDVTWKPPYRNYAPVLILIFKFTGQNFPFLIGLMQALWNRSLRTFPTKCPRARYVASFTRVK